jgi:hypothetical protein
MKAEKLDCILMAVKDLEAASIGSGLAIPYFNHFYKFFPNPSCLTIFSV